MMICKRQRDDRSTKARIPIEIEEESYREIFRIDLFLGLLSVDCFGVISTTSCSSLGCFFHMLAAERGRRHLAAEVVLQAVKVDRDVRSRARERDSKCVRGLLLLRRRRRVDETLLLR